MYNKNKSILLTILIATLLISKSLTFSTPTITLKSGLNPSAATAAITKLISELTEARSAIKHRRHLLRFQTSQTEPQPSEIQPLKDAFGVLTNGLDSFSKNFPDFFSATNLKESYKHLQDNSYDFFMVDKELTTNTLNSLGSGLLGMSRTKVTITTMLKGITDGLTLVENGFEKWQAEENKLDEAKNSQVFATHVKSLDRTLLNALVTCVEVSGQLGGIHEQMDVLGNNFGMLAFKFNQAMDKSSEIQVNYWTAFLKTAGKCGIQCLTGLWLAAPECVVCLGVTGTREAKAEEERVDRLLKENAEYLKMIDDSIGDLSKLALDLGKQAASEKITVDEFKTKMTGMENSLDNQKDLTFLNGSRDIIMGLMGPLRELCDTLAAAFDETSYEKPE
jgi:hypothetical protein